MSLAHRVERLSLRMGVEEDLPPPLVVICGPGHIRDEDRGLIGEIVQARLEGGWPRQLIHCKVTGLDLEAWREGRREEAIRGIRHQPGAAQA